MKKSKFNPAFVVDLANDVNVADVIKAFNDAKAKAGKPVCNYSPMTIVVVTVDIEDAEDEKQLPWYKRFWNWITRKK